MNTVSERIIVDRPHSSVRYGVDHRKIGGNVERVREVHQACGGAVVLHNGKPVKGIVASGEVSSVEMIAPFEFMDEPVLAVLWNGLPI